MVRPYYAAGHDRIIFFSPYYILYWIKVKCSSVNEHNSFKSQTIIITYRPTKVCLPVHIKEETKIFPYFPSFYLAQICDNSIVQCLPFIKYFWMQWGIVLAGPQPRVLPRPPSPSINTPGEHRRTRRKPRPPPSGRHLKRRERSVRHVHRIIHVKLRCHARAGPNE